MSESAGRRHQSLENLVHITMLPPCGMKCTKWDRLKVLLCLLLSNYTLNSKSFHNHRYLPFHIKNIYNQPTVKKPSLNKDDLSNYRPNANLSSIFKLSEKTVKKRFLDHLTSGSLLNPFQSAYTKFYSTKTTLLSLHDHLSNAICMQHVSCLCLLDLSAAFDTLDHSIPLHRLSTWFAFPMFHYNGSLHISHPVHLL